MARGFRRTPRGVEARIDDAEAAVLDELARQLTVLLGEDPASGDEALQRLLPDGYHDDPEAAAEFRELTQRDLVDAKRGSLDSITTGLMDRGPRGRLVLDDDQAEQWLTGLNDIRLALGTRLGVTPETHEEVESGRADVDEHAYAVYSWLGWLQESLVETLLRSLDEPASDR